MHTPQRILVRAPNWIGDQVLAYPFFHYLRQAYPTAHVTSVCMPWVASLQFRHLVDDVYVLPPPAKPSWQARFQALEDSARHLRTQGPWALGICLPNAWSAAWLLLRAGVQQRRGYATDGRRWLLHQALRWDVQATRHRADAYVHLLPEDVRPTHTVQDFWQHGTAAPVSFQAASAWPDTPCLPPPAWPYWVLAPGSMARSRCWPAASFVDLAQRIAQRTGWPGLVVGGPNEAALAERLCQSAATRLTDWTGRGPVAAYGSVFRQAQFTVSNDSGLAHVAALCGSPVHIVWGAGDPRITLPIGPGRVSLSMHPVPCWPCARNTCTQPEERQFACLTGIPPARVWQALSAP